LLVNFFKLLKNLKLKRFFHSTFKNYLKAYLYKSQKSSKIFSVNPEALIKILKAPPKS
jgi:hypothetical protein